MVLAFSLLCTVRIAFVSQRNCAETRAVLRAFEAKRYGRSTKFTEILTDFRHFFLRPAGAVSFPCSTGICREFRKYGLILPSRDVSLSRKCWQSHQKFPAK